jgi:DNA-directed RNA polymerase specialized sigma24 family protein
VECIPGLIWLNAHIVNQWDDVDFERLYKVLRVAAEAVVRHAPDTFNMGLSAQDLAHETFSAFLDSSTGLGWNPSRGTIEKFLTAVLWRKARTHLRRDRKVRGSLDDPAIRHLQPAASGSADADAQFENFKEKIFEAVGDDQELRDLIAAAEQTSGEHNVNQELADILGKPVRHVVNLKRRLLKNQKVVSFLWPKSEDR